jgi:GDP-L-fucose synthase
MANHDFPAEFLQQNLAIQSNVIHEAWRAGVKRLLFLGSSCIYPRDCPQPMREDYLLTGPLEFTNRPYAIAKIAGVEMCWAYNRQYGTRFLAAMPTNLYGPGDSYDLHNSHVLPALIRKFHEAKAGGRDTVTLWGSGAPLREFLHSDDMADACVFLMGLSDAQFAQALQPDASHSQPPLVNVGSGVEMSIRALAEELSQVIDFKGKIVWDASKPDGTPRKLLDVGRLQALGWQPKTAFRQGVAAAYRDFLERFGG